MLHGTACPRADGTLVIDRHSQGVHHPAHHGVARRDLDDTVGAPGDVALLDVDVRAEEGHPDGVLFEVEYDAERPARELHELTHHGAAKP